MPGRTKAKDKLMEAVLALMWRGSYGGTSVDDVCAKSGVKKGSLYHFFRSKADLAIQAMEVDWERKRPQLDAIFSPSQPPLERLKSYCTNAYQQQSEFRCQHDCVPGCYLFKLGAEISTEEQKVRAKVQEILDRYCRYFESTLRDACGAGLIKIDDPTKAAKTLWIFYEGMLTQARIQNDVEILKQMWPETRRILGITEASLPAV